MPIISVPCRVLGSNVTRVTDFEGAVAQLICPEYDERTGICRIREQGAGSGPLSQLLERVDEDTLARRDARCLLA